LGGDRENTRPKNATVKVASAPTCGALDTIRLAEQLPDMYLGLRRSRRDLLASIPSRRVPRGPLSTLEAGFARGGRHWFWVNVPMYWAALGGAAGYLAGRLADRDGCGST
jgi:hypothetical protein